MPLRQENIGNLSGPVNIANSGGWVVRVSNTGGTQLSITIANTSGISIANTANWSVFAVDSMPKVISITTVVSTIGTVTLMNSNAARVEGFVYNASQNPLFLRLGSSASTTFYTLMLVASGYYELPRPVFQGQITGIWATATGQALVTEIS